MSSFLGELKRRKVVRAGVIYGAVSFAALEGFEIVLSNLGLPMSLMRFLVVFAIMGLPLALVLAWYFELTPDGLKRAGDAGTPTRTPWLSTGAVVATSLFLVLGSAAWWLSSNLDAPAAFEPVSVDAASVAVLPFANLSDDPENEYFSDGLAEELLHVLAGVPGLKVAARTSSFSFKGRVQDVREVGRSLAVATVLEGSVRKSQDRVRINAQLVQAEDGFQLWSQSYDRELDDIFALQDEIAMSIVDAMEMTLVGGVEDLELEPVTTNQMAYDKYLWGRYNLGKRTEAGIQEAIENFSGSIMLDSTYARAYSGLADANLLLPSVAAGDAVRPGDAYAAGLAMARRAVELGPDLAESHASLGGALLAGWELEGGVRSLDRATELNHQYSLAHQWSALPLALLGRYNEALAAARAAASLDPLSAVAVAELGLTLRYVRRPADAVEQYDVALALDPDHAAALEGLALSYIELGAWDEARESYGRWAAQVGRDPLSVDRLVQAARTFADGGPPGDASEVIRQESRSAWARARWHALVGEDERAILEIQRAFDARHGAFWTVADPLLERLRSDPRVEAVGREIGIRW
ncbi:MAG: hypothetical protein HKN73_19225 [Gemmatimonadetes bacterium]|nr:hypothetical protein [Gemmatimonadota bacterium]